MGRRETYSVLSKTKWYYDPQTVKVNGQRVYRVFQCLRPGCTQMLVVKEDDLDDSFSVICPECGYEHYAGGEQPYFDYSMDVRQTESGEKNSVEKGVFSVSHDEYVLSAPQYKYCVLCKTLKPLESFHRHAGMGSGHQSECVLCKSKYNPIKNPTRTADQHFESGQKRRLLLDVAGSFKVNRNKIEKRYEYKCFCCGTDLSRAESNKEKPIDHTLPVYYLWPATTESGTLLCRRCNGEKSGKWPSDFYSDKKLHKLAVKTGYDYELLAGRPQYNPEALRRLQSPVEVDALLEKYAAYMDEVCRLRNRILVDTGIDFFRYATELSPTWVEYADKLRK